MGQVASSPQAQSLRLGEQVQYNGQTFSVARDDITGRNQFININTGEVHNPYSIFITDTPSFTNTSESIARRCQKCGGRGNNCSCMKR